jgi:squalene-hopene/tetraprenyl-beta-curcumene cyclase
VTTPAAASSWDAQAAAKYLDGRELWWSRWPTSQRDHETVCVSCHTVLPYVLSRRALRGTLHEEAPSAIERSILAGVTKRVSLWSDVKPFYSDAEAGPRKTVESRGTEVVFNALILANYDAEQGTLSPATKMAFDNMWALQLKTGDQTGGWEWLNFHNAPWEADESQYMGAVMAAVAVGLAPANYAADPKIQPSLELLKSYLTKYYNDQPLVNRLIVLLASTRVSGLLTAEQRKSLEDAVYSQQREDGGWSLPTFGKWKRHDDTPLSVKSDGYATGLAVFALEQAGVPRTQAHIEKGLAWLEHNQDHSDGLWPSYSLNKERDPASDIGRFMSDAATAYAVMALKNSF